MTHLEKLGLVGTRVRGPGLTQLQGLPELTTLNIGGAIDSTALAALRGFKHLKEVYIGADYGLASQELEAFRRDMPGVTIRTESDQLTPLMRAIVKLGHDTQREQAETKK